MITLKKTTYDQLSDAVRSAVQSVSNNNIVIDDSKISPTDLQKIINCYSNLGFTPPSTYVTINLT